MCCFPLFTSYAHLNQGTVFSNNPGGQEPHSFSRGISLWCVSPEDHGPQPSNGEDGAIGTWLSNGHMKGQDVPAHIHANRSSEANIWHRYTSKLESKISSTEIENDGKIRSRDGM